MSDALREELDTLLAACAEKALWSNEDRARLQRFFEQLGKVREVAQALGVSKATLRWWVRRETKKDQLRPPPPADKLQSCRGLILEQHFRRLLKSPPSSAAAASGFYDVFLRLRNFNEIMERAGLAENLWAFRFGRPFKAGLDQQLFDDTVQFVLEHQTNLFFVYRDPEPEDPEAMLHEAKKSFAAIQLKIEAHPQRQLLRRRIRGVAVRGAQADKLGLVDPWASFAAAEYNDRGYLKYQRVMDVWLENFFEGTEEKQLLWLELPPAEAVKWKQRRAAILAEALRQSAGQPDRSN